MNTVKILSCIFMLTAIPHTIFAAAKIEVKPKKTVCLKNEPDQKKAQAVQEAAAQLIATSAQTVQERFTKKEIPQDVCDAALLEAAKTGKHSEIVRILLEEKANPGTPVLLASAEAGNPLIVALLLDTRDLEATAIGQVAVWFKTKGIKPSERIQILFDKYPGKQTDELAKKVEELAQKKQDIEGTDLLQFGKFVTELPKLVLTRFLPTIAQQIKELDANSQRSKNLQQIKKTLESLNIIMFDCPSDNIRLLSSQSSDEPWSDEGEATSPSNASQS